MKKLSLIISLFLAGLSSPLKSQHGVTNFGFQYKPILPVEFFNVQKLSITNNDFTSTISQQLGHNIGGIIRWNPLKRFSFESGVNYVRRNFSFTTSVNSSGTSSKGNFGIVGYEVPIKGMVLVQLDQNSFLSVSSGIATSWIASDVATATEDDNFYQVTYTKKMNLAFIANVGYEYRTDKSGTFYLGASLTTPFQGIGLIDVHYDEYNQTNQKLTGVLLGNYLTVDLRYYFHEDKKRKKE